MLIRTLIIKENDIYNQDTDISSDGSEINNCEDPLNDSEFREDPVSSYLEEILEESVLVNSAGIEEVITDWDSYFKSLYLQFEEESRSIAKEDLNR